MPELEERLAAAYAAETDAELAMIMHDLRASPPQPGDWAGAAPTSMRDVGIIAGFQRKGRWMVGRTFRAGGDRQRRDRPPSGPVHRRRDDYPRHRDHRQHHRRGARRADVHIGGTGIVGGFDHHDEGPGTPGAPRITITGCVFCGTVDVERRSAHAETPNPKLKRARRRVEGKQRQLERKQLRS
jgi:hypothetical protein